MNILFWFTERAILDNAETQKCVRRIADKYNVNYELTKMKDYYSPWKALQKYWGKDDLFIIDQDILFEPWHLEAMMCCGQDLCTRYYKVSSTYQKGKKDDLSTIGWYPYKIYNRAHVYTMEQAAAKVNDYVEFSANGFIKISKKLQKNEMLKFNLKEGIDNAIIKTMNRGRKERVKFHVHTEVGHDHKFSLLDKHIKILGQTL